MFSFLRNTEVVSLRESEMPMAPLSKDYLKFKMISSVLWDWLQNLNADSALGGGNSENQKTA